MPLAPSSAGPSDPVSTVTGRTGSAAASAPPVARRWRLALLAPAGVALLVGMASGLGRLGLPVGFGPLTDHGPLLVLGFLGTLIALERAVAVGERWAYAPVVIAAAGAVALVLGVPGRLVAPVFVVAGLGVLAVYGATLRRQPSLHLGVMAVGGLAWPVAAAHWLLGAGPAELVAPLAAFLVLTIVGERLELSRLSQPPRRVRLLLLAAVALFLVGVVASLWSVPVGWAIAGAGLVAQAVWLARYDLARRTVRTTGLPRYAAVCLLTGFAWLGLGGVLWGWHALAPLAFTYDAAVHAVFLGFVVSMVFGHAPIILPAVLRIRLAYRPVLYAPLALLHTTLGLRVVADLAGWVSLREVAGSANVVAVLAFAAAALSSVRLPRGEG